MYYNNQRTEIRGCALAVDVLYTAATNVWTSMVSSYQRMDVNGFFLLCGEKQHIFKVVCACCYGSQKWDVCISSYFSQPRFTVGQRNNRLSQNLKNTAY
jgi:hypothetical protein